MGLTVALTLDLLTRRPRVVNSCEFSIMFTVTMFMVAWSPCARSPQKAVIDRVGRKALEMMPVLGSRGQCRTCPRTSIARIGFSETLVYFGAAKIISLFLQYAKLSRSQLCAESD